MHLCKRLTPPSFLYRFRREFLTERKVMEKTVIITGMKGKRWFAHLKGDSGNKVYADNLCYAIGNLVCILSNQGNHSVSIEPQRKRRLKSVKAPGSGFPLYRIPALETKTR